MFTNFYTEFIPNLYQIYLSVKNSRRSEYLAARLYAQRLEDERRKNVYGSNSGAFSLYADKTALSLTLDANGDSELSKNTVTVTFDKSYFFHVPTREGYTFLGWYDEGTRLTDEEGGSVYAWSYALDMTDRFFV